MKTALRTATVTACVGLLVSGLTGVAAADEPKAEPKAESPGTPLYLVHGYGYDDKDAEGKPMKGNGKDCNKAWNNATEAFPNKWGWTGEMKTVGYYEGDKNCSVTIGDGKATTDTRIKTLAAGLAKDIYENHTKNGESVDVVAHSMGGLITRVALLGSAKGWEGFPKELKVGDVVTLGTPHEGIERPNANDDTQWKSMRPGSPFMDVLDKKKNSLGEWGTSTDWSFVGANEDETVGGDSAIDKGDDSNHKYRYKSGGSHELGHSELRSYYKGDYELRYWHAKEGKEHNTSKGWSPLETAFHAVDKNDKW